MCEREGQIPARKKESDTNCKYSEKRKESVIEEEWREIEEKKIKRNKDGEAEKESQIRREKERQRWTPREAKTVRDKDRETKTERDKDRETKTVRKR